MTYIEYLIAMFFFLMTRNDLKFDVKDLRLDSRLEGNDLRPT